MKLRKLTWQGQKMVNDGEYHYTWVPTPPPVGGEVCSMGSLGMGETGTYGTATHYEVPITTWGDYVGGSVERSNYRSLLRDYPETFIDVCGDYGSHYLAISIADLCFMSTDDATDLLDIMEKMVDHYPLYDDEDHTMLEMEVLEEDWDLWIKSDIVWSIIRKGGEFTEDEEAHLQEWFHEWLSELNESPYLESATSIVVPQLDDFTQTMAWYIGGPKCQ